MNKERTIQTLLLDGGSACLDFTNTVNSRQDEEVYDYLGTYGDLLEWSARVKLLPKGRLDKLRAAAGGNGEKAARILADIKHKRELLYRVLSSVIHNKEVDEATAGVFNDALTASLAHVAFKFNKGDVRLGWNESEIDLREPLWVVFKDAYDILTSMPLKRLKECRECGWLFLDQSKNNSRTWCNMKTCGSAVKAKRYYYRQKKKK